MDGFLLIAAEDSEVVVMNAVGVANLSDLAALGEFGKLAGAAASPPQPNQTAPATAAPKPARMFSRKSMYPAVNMACERTSEIFKPTEVFVR